jgi:hypothetical protein
VTCRVRFYQSDVWELYQGDQNGTAIAADCTAWTASATVVDVLHCTFVFCFGETRVALF